MTVAARGGVDAVNGPTWREDPTQRLIFNTDRGSTYTANSFTTLCRKLRGTPVHEPGRVSSVRRIRGYLAGA